MGSEPPTIEPKDYMLGPKSAKVKRVPASPLRWVVQIVGWTFVISILLSLISGTLIPRMNIVLALLALLCFIALGVFFDILGLSVATASTKPFHSMAAHRVPGAVHALRLLRHPERITSFCNDVVGDIAGVVSGATASVIVTRLAQDNSPWSLFWQVLLAAIVSSLTVAGKAWGKTVSLKHNVYVVTQMGKAIYRHEQLMKRFSRR